MARWIPVGLKRAEDVRASRPAHLPAGFPRARLLAPTGGLSPKLVAAYVAATANGNAVLTRRDYRCDCCGQLHLTHCRAA